MVLHEKHTRGIALAIVAACTLALPLCASASEASVDIETTSSGTGTATVYIETETNGQKHTETYTSQNGSIGVSVEATSSGYTTHVWGADTGSTSQGESSPQPSLQKTAPRPAFSAHASSAPTSTPQQTVQISGSENAASQTPGQNFFEKTAAWFFGLFRFFMR